MAGGAQVWGRLHSTTAIPIAMAGAMTITDVEISDARAPARSPDTKPAVAYLVASGATRLVRSMTLPRGRRVSYDGYRTDSLSGCA